MNKKSNMLLTFAKRTQRDIWAGASGSLFKLDAEWKETAPEISGSSWQADTQTCVTAAAYEFA